MSRLKFLASVVGCALAACGGGGGAAPTQTSASISGAASGLPSGTLLLSNAGTETIAVAANGGFSFAKRVAEGSAYDVTIVGQPNMTSCAVANGKGTVAHDVDSVSNVSVTCTSAVGTPYTTFNVGATVSGLLAGNSVALMNNGADTVTASDNGLFLFPAQVTATVYSGRAGGYEVSVKTQPSNQSCTVSNGSGAVTAGANNFVDVLVSCK